MSTVQQIADHLRAANSEHVRAIIEPDDNMVLIDYLESQGFISAEAQAAKDAEAQAVKDAEAAKEAEAKEAEAKAKADEVEAAEKKKGKK